MMSREKPTIVEKNKIIARFVEVCGSEEPTKIKQLLNISYQAARNYVKGRVPTTEILLAIAENTPYSIHWLLTGEGNKFVQDGLVEDAQILTGEMRASVKEVCVEAINEYMARREAEPKIVLLPSDKLKSEKAMETPALSENISLTPIRTSSSDS
jgi:hypothetical protein